MTDIILNTKLQNSVIHCGAGTFEKYAEELAKRQIIVVTDSNVFAWYRHDIWRIFGDKVPVYILPAGETAKTMRYLTAILKCMQDSNMKRSCTVVAFGGGVVGDIAGLAASLYMRGVSLVQIPTTLLAQVDSSVGGKTAIDFGGIKNLIGTFHQPEAVIVDPCFLATLPEREVRCGLGEIVKYGALNSNIFRLLNKNITNLKSPDFLQTITYHCIKHKADVVAEDEHDIGLRKTLNLGHTTGHALELYYRKKSHGEYVLVGMFYELFIAQKLNTCAQNYANSLKNLIISVIKKIPVYDDIASAAELAKFDKKNSQSSISLIVPVCEGKCTELNIPAYQYVQMLEECVAAIKGEA